MTSAKTPFLRNIAITAVTTLLLCTALSAHAVPYSASVLTDNPLAYYRFEETNGSNAANETGIAANDGTYSGTANLTAAGPPNPGFGPTNSATNFVPSGAAVNTPVSLNALSAFTLELWFRLPAAPTEFRVGMIGQDNIVEFGFIDPLTIQLWTEVTFFDGVNNVIFDTTDSANLDRWMHLVGVGTGTESQIFLNGSLINAVPYTAVGDYGSNLNLVNIGGDPIFGGDGSPFPGDIDEVAIYDTALTAAQIRAHYNAARAIPEPATLALMGLGLAGIGCRRHRSKKVA